MNKDLLNKQFENYEYCYGTELPESESVGVVLRHKKSGARIALVSNEDENKVFYVTFRTTPFDSTGVAHIIEHTVLCGSEKYPVKDPFIELAKGSLNTFLNALTYPDKTVYPIASCNDKDFQNLMSVYMDAVFHPNIYKHEEIFKQEGWHYELNDPDDELIINGVVYNEMIGAFTSPEDALGESIKQQLYPSNTYGYCSGGHPEMIPSLTYEDYLAFHSKYYHPSNSYIYLYGNMDMEEKLKWLDEEYLSKYDTIELDSTVGYQPRFSYPKAVMESYPIAEDEDPKDKTYLAYNVMLNSYDDLKKTIAYSLLSGVLFGQQGAPVKQALIDAGIGSDSYCYYDADIKQTNFQVVAVETNPDQVQKFVDVIESALRDVVKNGIDKQSLLSALAASEFANREADTGRYPKGLVMGINMLRTWLHNDDMAFTTCKRQPIYDELRREIDNGYFEHLVEMLLDEPHKVIFVFKPEPGLQTKREEALREKLRAYKATLSDEEVNKLVEDTRKLREWQEEEETEENLATLPVLKVSDVRKEADKLVNEERDVDGTKVVFHDLPTRGIVYAKLYFDMKDVEPGFWAYASALQSMLGSMNTAKHSYFELTNDVMLYSAGSLNEALNSYYTVEDRKACNAYMTYSFKALSENVGKTLEILSEIIASSDFTDKKRLRENLAEMVNSQRMALLDGGITTAMKRAKSYFSLNDTFDEETDGIEFYRVIKYYLENFDEKADELVDKMLYVLEKVVRADNMLVSVTSRDAEYAEFTDAFTKFKAALRENDAKKTERVKPEVKELKGAYGALNEAFKISGGIQYCATASNFKDKGLNITSAAAVLKTMLSYDYLWQNVRVKGGAYGCFFDYNKNSGNCGIVSYRDPNLKSTYEVFKAAAEAVKNMDLDQETVDKYIIGTMSNIDVPMSPAAKGTFSMTGYMIGQSDEMRQRNRDEILGATPETVKAAADILTCFTDNEFICTVGGETKVNENKDMFGAVLDLK